jgi:hypothetical protein
VVNQIFKIVSLAAWLSFLNNWRHHNPDRMQKIILLSSMITMLLATATAVVFVKISWLKFDLFRLVDWPSIAWDILTTFALLAPIAALTWTQLPPSMIIPQKGFVDWTKGFIAQQSSTSSLVGDQIKENWHLRIWQLSPFHLVCFVGAGALLGAVQAEHLLLRQPDVRVELRGAASHSMATLVMKTDRGIVLIENKNSVALVPQSDVSTYRIQTGSLTNNIAEAVARTPTTLQTWWKFLRLRTQSVSRTVGWVSRPMSAR